MNKITMISLIKTLMKILVVNIYNNFSKYKIIFTNLKLIFMQLGNGSVKIFFNYIQYTHIQNTIIHQPYK